MNKLLKEKKGYKGGIKGTKFVPKNQGANNSQKVAKGKPQKVKHTN